MNQLNATGFETFRMQKALQAHPGWTKQDVQEYWLYEQQIRHEYAPYVGFRPRPLRSRFINVTEHGYRVVEGQCPWPLQQEALNIFVFGGSTTFGFGLEDSESIPSHLQAILSKSESLGKVCVYNFGRPNYFSVHERILFEDLLVAGHLPQVAVFIDGLNDFVYWRGTRFEKALKEIVEEINQEGVSAWQRNLGDFLEHLPIGRVARKVQRLLYLKEGDQVFSDQEIIDYVLKRWLVNKKIIETAAKKFGIEVLFVWQPVPLYKYDLKYHLFREEIFRDRLPHSIAYAEMVQSGLRKKLEGEGKFLWLADMLETRKENVFVGAVHYTGRFSGEIAGQIANRLLDRLRRQP